MRITPGAVGEARITDGTNFAAVVAATATLEETDVQYLTVANAMYAFRTTELRRLTARVPADGVTIPTTDGLETNALPTLIAPDGALDMGRSVGDTAALGLGVQATSPRTPGAGEVQSLTATITASQSTRRTHITPASGLRIRVISATGMLAAVGGAPFEVYFGTGANIATTPANSVSRGEMSLAAAPDRNDNFTETFPDGGGPIGDVDEVLSTRGGSVDYNPTIAWREE